MTKIFALIALLPATASVCFASSNNLPENVGVTYQSLVNATTGGVTLLTANSARNALIIQNQSASSTLSISFGGAALGSSTIQISGGTMIQFTPPFVNAVYGKSSAGTIPVLVIEGIK